MFKATAKSTSKVNAAHTRDKNVAKPLSGKQIHDMGQGLFRQVAPVGRVAPVAATKTVEEDYRIPWRERLRYSSRLQLSQPRFLAVKLCALARRLGTEKLELLLKEQTVGRTPPHLRLDTRPRLGHGLVYPTLFGSARRALCSKGSDVVRRVAAGVTPTAGESVRGRRCFTIRGVDQAGNHCITQFLVERTNESSGVSQQRYHFES